MKVAYFIVLVIILQSCGDSNSTLKESFKLIDNDSLMLGTVTCRLPVDFDTSYTWISSSDCHCCGAVVYRSHSSKFDIITESGFLLDTHLDSGYYFSISHFPWISCDTSSEYFYTHSLSTSETKKRRFEEYIKELEDYGGTKVIFDTSRAINDNKYQIFYFTENNYYKIPENGTSSVKTVSFNVLSATTKYKSRRISFVIQSNVHQRDSFYNMAMNILKSVKIE